MLKKFFTSLVLFALSAMVFAGSYSHNAGQERKGYIGFTFGPSVPVGDFSEGDPSTSPKAGLQFTMAHFGYSFANNFGLAATLQGGFFPLDYSNEDFDNAQNENWSYASMMVGPLLTVPVSEKVQWDFRPMVGFSLITKPEMDNNEQTTAFSYSFGSSFRFNVSKGLALLLTADYIRSEPTFNAGKVRVETLAFGVGLAFRLK